MKKAVGSGRAKTGVASQTFRTGVQCRTAGTWMPSCGCKATILRSGTDFPPCAQCGKSVDYELARSANR